MVEFRLINSNKAVGLHRLVNLIVHSFMANVFQIVRDYLCIFAQLSTKDKVRIQTGFSGVLVTWSSVK